MPAFSTLLPEALAFFDALAANNSRDWFTAHKPDYERQVKRPAKALLDEVAQELGRTTGVAQNTKLYRVNRDLRFTKDKTPYNTHLHLQWSDPATGICHLFGASRNYVCAGVGAMMFSKQGLGLWRDRIGSNAGSDFDAGVSALIGLGHRLDTPDLKRVPSPYQQDHPRAELLKRKGIVLWHDFDDDEQADPLGALQGAFGRLAGFRRDLAALITP